MRPAERVRELLEAEGLDGVLVGSDDRFLNEYVPKADSTRAWLTGFQGSTGDAFLGREVGWVAIDGRYYLQADEELAGSVFEPLRVELGVSVWKALCKRVAQWAVESGARRLGFAAGRTSARAHAALKAALKEAGSEAQVVGVEPSLPERARGPIEEAQAPLREVSPEGGGGSVAEKLERLAPALREAKLDAYVVQRLDELAWLVNLRGTELPFQATFRAAGLLRPQSVRLALRGLDRAPATEGVTTVHAVAGFELAAALGDVEAGQRVGYDPAGATAAVPAAIRERGAEPVKLKSPIAPLRSAKSPGELAAMRDAFARADRVMEASIAFVQERLAAGERVTEADLADKIEAGFMARGASGLSFRVIAGAGANGANIHYGPPDPQRAIVAGELVLIDTGGYFDEGYATDLTRTFLAGDGQPTPTQRARFTHVLRAAVAGMSARFPVGTRGEQLDALVRAPLWEVGLDYTHGTGHGVGVNVHEAPPRITTRAPGPLEAGQVFSIEPGVYVAGWGGIRIENLCTTVVGEDGFLEVEALTFAALDERLIDDELLSQRERRWLEGYRAQRERTL